MPVRPDSASVIKPQDLDQLFVTDVGLDEALPAHERSTLEPSLGRLLSQRVHDFMDGVESAVAPEELCRQRLGAPAPDPPVGQSLNGDTESFSDLADRHGVPRGAFVRCHRAASASARSHKEARR